MTDARIVYASPENLYVATERWADRPDPATPTTPQTGVIDRDPQVRHLEPDADAVPRQRQVSGYLLSQWSLSEYRGVLRVVSTERPRGGARAARASRP